MGAVPLLEADTAPNTSYEIIVDGACTLVDAVRVLSGCRARPVVALSCPAAGLSDEHEEGPDEDRSGPVPNRSNPFQP